jgi:eukaryotic-like serine/threonine-protein kinase
MESFKVMWEKFNAILREKSPKSVLIHIALIIWSFVLLSLLFFFVYLPSTTNHGEAITVPNLEGMPLEDMDDFLKKRHLNYEVSDSGYSAQYEPLAILKQYPLQGEKVKEGRKIYLTVKAKEPQTVKMPNLIDGSLKNAELVLRSYGLHRGKITYRPDMGVNVILEQWVDGQKINPGDKVQKGSFIDLIVGDGLGQQVFGIPRFIGLPLDEANFSVRASGLNIGSVIIRVVDEEITRQINDLSADLEIDSISIIQSGFVFNQSPMVGEEVRLGEQVDLWVVSLTEEDSLDVLLNWVNRSSQETGN